MTFDRAAADRTAPDGDGADAPAESTPTAPEAAADAATEASSDTGTDSSIARPGSKKKTFRLGDIFAWDGDHLAVTHDDAMKALTRPALSPSTAKAMHGCVARWAAERLIDEPPNPFSAAEVGTSGHSVLEDLFGLPKFSRTRQQALLILESHKARMWPNRDASTVAKASDWHAKVHTAINGLWTIEEPTTVEVAGLETGFDGATVRGIPFNGFIDRLDWVADPETGRKRLKIVDYKALALDTLVPTPTGWSTIADLAVGEHVIGLDGLPTKIIGKSPVFVDRPCWEVRFSDGSAVVADDQHRWAIEDAARDRVREVVTTDVLAKRLADVGGEGIFLPNTAAVLAPDGTMRAPSFVDRYVAAVVAVESRATQCISVAATDEMFLVGPNFAPSKNTGKVPKDITRFGDDHGDQMRLYAEAIRSKRGEMPLSASLYYTQHGKSRDVPLSKAAMSKTLRSFEQSWADLNAHTERKAYPTQDGPLCGWCPLVNACPVATQNGRVDRTGTAPTTEFLGIPVHRILPPKPVEPAPEIPDYDFGSAPAVASYDDYDFGSDFGAAATGANPVASAPTDDFGSAAVDAAVPADTSAAAPIPVGYEPQPDLIHNTSQPDDAGERIAAPAAHVQAEHLDVPVAYDPSTTSPTVPATPLAAPEGNTMSTPTFSEDKSWFEESGGVLNANSYSAMAVFGTTSLAYDQIAKAGIPLSKDTLDGLSKTFLFIVQQVHNEFGSNPTLMDGLSTRLRGLLRSVIEAQPLPWGGDKAAWDAWVVLVHKHVRSLTLASLRLYQDGPGQEPWNALAVAPVAAVTG